MRARPVVRLLGAIWALIVIGDNWVANDLALRFTSVTAIDTVNRPTSSLFILRSTCVGLFPLTGAFSTFHPSSIFLPTLVFKSPSNCL